MISPVVRDAMRRAGEKPDVECAMDDAAFQAKASQVVDRMRSLLAQFLTTAQAAATFFESEEEQAGALLVRDAMQRVASADAKLKKY